MPGRRALLSWHHRLDFEAILIFIAEETNHPCDKESRRPADASRYISSNASEMAAAFIGRARRYRTCRK